MAGGLRFLEVREQFLPVRRAALRERMLDDERLSAEEREQFDRLFEMVAARFHFAFLKKLEHLKAVYAPFDPDSDTLPVPDVPADVPRGCPDFLRRPCSATNLRSVPRPAAKNGTVPFGRDQEAQQEELSRAFEKLLLDANYVKMPQEQIIACAEYQAQVGLVVRANFSDYAQLQVYYRGVKHQPRSIRSWFGLGRRKDEIAHVFSRVALLVRLAKSPHGPVFLKLFKNVVAEDLEMLLPYVRIRMRLRDHLKIGSSVAGGVATASWKVITATIFSPWLLLLVTFGFTVAAIRGIFSFLASKTKYMQALSSSLYFQNLANNFSALAHLVDSAEAEQCKEVLLAYYILYLERDRDLTRGELDRRVEEWLRTEFGLEVDFAVRDAVRKLAEMDLLVHGPASASGAPAHEGVLKVCDLPTALGRLDAAWESYASEKVEAEKGVRCRPG